MLLNITIDNLEDSAVESSTWFVCTLTSNCSCEHLVITATPPPSLSQLTISTCTSATCIQPEKGRKLI